MKNKKLHFRTPAEVNIKSGKRVVLSLFVILSLPFLAKSYSYKARSVVMMIVSSHVSQYILCCLNFNYLFVNLFLRVYKTAYKILYDKRQTHTILGTRLHHKLQHAPIYRLSTAHINIHIRYIPVQSSL